MFSLKPTIRVVLILYSTLVIQACGPQLDDGSKDSHTDIIQELNRCLAQVSNEVSAALLWYKPEQDFDRSAFFEEMYGAPNPHEQCVDELVSDYLDLWMKSCMKYRCGSDIGGGCAHLAGLREGGPVYAALSHCKQLHPIDLSRKQEGKVVTTDFYSGRNTMLSVSAEFDF